MNTVKIPRSKSKKYDPYSFLVGGVAEKVIEQLFLSLGYHVFPFGMENTIPEIKGLLNGNKSETAKQIRCMPDFVVKKDADDPVLVEVKYRSNGEFTYKDLIQGYEDYPYQNALVVVVSPRHIKAVFASELQKRPITAESKNYLGNVRELKFTREEKDKIISFCNYATHFFDGVADLR